MIFVSLSNRLRALWKWEAELLMATGPTQEERICKIYMADATSPLPNGLRLSICYNDTSSAKLHLQKLHSVSDVFILLRACSPIQQYCKILPQSDKDANSLKALSSYMTRRREVSVPTLFVLTY